MKIVTIGSRSNLKFKCIINLFASYYEKNERTTKQLKELMTFIKRDKKNIEIQTSRKGRINRRSNNSNNWPFYRANFYTMVT